MFVFYKNTVFSANEITKAGVALARTGIIGRQGMASYNKIMESSIILAGAFWRQGVTLENTVESVTRTMNQFGYSSEQAGRVVNALAGASAFTLTNIQDLQKGLSYAGAAASSLGKDVEETVAVLGLLSNMGITGGRAGRMYRNIMVRLSKATKDGTTKQKELFDEMRKGSKEFDNLNLKTMSMAQIMGILNKANLDLADSTDLVRQRAVVAFMVMMRESGQLAELTENIKTSAKAFEMYSIQMETLSAKWKIFTNNIQAFGITIGAILAPEIGKILGLLTNMIQKLDSLSTAQKKILLISGIFVALGTAILGVTLALAGFFYAAQFGLGFILSILAPILIKFTMLSVIVGSVVVVAMLLKRTFKVLKDSVDDKFMEPFRDALSMTVEAIKTIVDNIVRFIQTLIQLPSIIKNTIKRMKLGDDNTIGDDLAASVIEAFDKTEGMSKLWEQITYGFDEGVKKPLAESAAIVADEMKATFGEISDFLKNKFPDAAGYIDEALARAKAGIGDLSVALGMLGDKNREEMTRVSKLITDMAGSTDAIIEKISVTWSDTIFDLLKGTTTFAEVWQAFLDDALKNFLHGFVRGMLEGWGQMLGQMVAEFVRAQYFMAGIQAMLGMFSAFFSGGGGTAAQLGSGQWGTTYKSSNVPTGFPMSDGGIVTRPTRALIGESGPEAVVPLDEYNRGGGSLTIINVVDTNFVNAQIAQDPDTVINVINADLIRGGSTRKTIKRIK